VRVARQQDVTRSTESPRVHSYPRKRLHGKPLDKYFYPRAEPLIGIDVHAPWISRNIWTRLCIHH